MLQYQTNNSTYYGRHWVEFQVLRQYFRSDKDLSILSFGCSTGEELLLLRKLFPGAKLHGCDIDWTNLLSSRSLLKSDATVFFSDWDEIQRHGPYDIISCNSVLLVAPTRMTPEGPRGLPAEFWLESIGQFDKVLKPGGVIQLINSNYPFRLHPVAPGYEVLRSPLIVGPHFADQFDLDGNRLCVGQNGLGMSPHCNLHFGEQWQSLVPEDLSDTHFRKAGGAVLTPVADQKIPNFIEAPVLARGEASYVSVPPPDRTVASFLHVKLAYEALGAAGVRIHRTATRQWFDGSLLAPSETTVEIQGPLAAAWVEALLGRPSTRLTLMALDEGVTINSPIF